MVRQRLSHGFPVSYVVDRLLYRALSKQVRGRVLEKQSVSVFVSVHLMDSLSNKFVNIAAGSCMVQLIPVNHGEMGKAWRFTKGHSSSTEGALSGIPGIDRYSVPCPHV